MINYEFWRNWKRKTKIEESAIKAIIKTKKAILNKIPKNKLVAIYIKGSFVRREMNNKSDVDIVPIVTENKYEKAIFSVNTDEIYPCTIAVPLSLWEFKHNKLYTKNNKPRAKPDLFIRKLENYKLIYGKPLDITGFKIRSDEECLKALMKTFRKSFIPLYKKGKFGFLMLVKELFWLVDLEQTNKGKKVEHSFKGIAKSVDDRKHIIHDALKFRLKPIKDKKIRERFIIKLEMYLDELERRFRR